MRCTITARGQAVVPVALSANRAGTACTKPQAAKCPTVCWTIPLRISRQPIPIWPLSDSELDGSKFRISCRGFMLSQAAWPRGIVKRLQESLADTPVVLLNGPRQSGKTTLVRQFASEQRPYLSLDDATTCAAARPGSRPAGCPDRPRWQDGDALRHLAGAALPGAACAGLVGP